MHSLFIFSHGCLHFCMFSLLMSLTDLMAIQHNLTPKMCGKFLLTVLQTHNAIECHAATNSLS